MKTHQVCLLFFFDKGNMLYIIGSKLLQIEYNVLG